MGDEAFQASGDALRRGASAAYDWMRSFAHHPARFSNIGSFDASAPNYRRQGTMDEDNNRRVVDMREHELSNPTSFDPLSVRGTSTAEVQKEITEAKQKTH